jgi:transcriptional regulator with XRE-family HTH domain
MGLNGPRRRDDAFARVFGANLTRCREEAGISQEELGFRADLHRTAVGQLERGQRIARTDTLVRLAASLGVGTDALLAGLRWRAPQLVVGELEIEPAKTSQPKQSKAAASELKGRPVNDLESQQ